MGNWDYNLEPTDVTVTRHKRLTTATAAIEWLPGLVGQGQALRSKNDVRLDEIGENIALGRALMDLGAQIEALGHSQCVTKEEYDRVKYLIDQRSAITAPPVQDEKIVPGSCVNCHHTRSIHHVQSVDGKEECGCRPGSIGYGRCSEDPSCSCPGWRE